MKTLFKKNILLFLIPIISAIIIFSWFYEGKIVSNGSEEDLNIYHLQKNAEYYSSFWYPVGTGFKTPFHIVRYPTFFTLGLLEQTGMPPYLTQAVLLWILMVTGISTMYLLLRKAFNMTWQVSLLGSLFYLLNIFSMTQVWKRFLYQGIFAWAYLPLFLLLWIKWIESKKKLWLFIFAFTSIFFAYTFSQPANLMTIWIPAGIFVLIKLWQSRFKRKEAAITILTSIVGFVLWSLVNIWWLYPMLALGSTWTETTGQTWESDLSSLHAVSKSFPIWEVLLLRQSWYLSPENDLGSFYQNPLIILISVLILFFVILAIVKLKNYPYRGFVLSLAFVGFFISKGTSFPFGYTFFYLLFSNFPLTTALRNSYEKFGLVWLVSYTILFAFGFSKFLSFLKPKRGYLFGGIILFLILGVLVAPLWTGGLFPQKHRLNVPQYYSEANSYLSNQPHLPNRVFHIPFLLDLERVIYTWGYIGQDPSQNLFEFESATTPKIPYFHRSIEILPEFLSNKNFPEILGLFSVSNVILHKDSIYPKINIEESIKIIESWEGIGNKKEFGQLVIYSLDKPLVRPRIYVATYVIPVTSIEDELTEVISSNIGTATPVFIEGETPEIMNIQIKNVPKITFKKISNDLYFVDVKGSTEPFILVLNNTFDNLWQTEIDNQLINKHFMVNGFANAWLIEKTGDYQVDIRLKVWPWD